MPTPSRRHRPAVHDAMASRVSAMVRRGIEIPGAGGGASLNIGFVKSLSAALAGGYLRSPYSEYLGAEGAALIAWEAHSLRNRPAGRRGFQRVWHRAERSIESRSERLDVMTLARHTMLMTQTSRRSTIYLDPELHRALRLKAAETSDRCPTWSTTL